MRTKTVRAHAQQMLTAKQEATGEVERIYVHEGRGLNESAKLLNCSPTSLARWLDDHGYDRRDVISAQDLRRKREENPDQKKLRERVVDLHHKGATLETIAAETGLSSSTAWYILNKQGLTRKYSSRKVDGEGNGVSEPSPSTLANFRRRHESLVQERRRLVVDVYIATGWSITKMSRDLHETHAFIRETLGIHGLIAAASEKPSATEEQTANT